MLLKPHPLGGTWCYEYHYWTTHLFYSQCWAEDRLYSKWLHVHQQNKGHASFSNNKLAEYRLLLHDIQPDPLSTSSHFLILFLHAHGLCLKVITPLDCWYSGQRHCAMRHWEGCNASVTMEHVYRQRTKLLTDYPIYRLFSVGSKTEVIGCWDIIWFNHGSGVLWH